MDASVQPQLKILNDCLENEANYSKDLIAQALQALSNLVSEITDVDNAKLLIESILLGLINFIKELRKRTNVENEIVSTTFSLMDTLLFDFDGISQHHFEPVHDLLNTCIFWANVLEIRLQSFLLLKKLVEHESCQSVPESLAKYKRIFELILMKTESVTSSTEKKVIYQLMGSIIKHFPQVLVNLKDQRKVFRKLECDISSLIKKDKGITELEGILECMNSYLFHFFDNMNEDTSNSLYLSVKKICEEAKSRRTSAREALKLVGHHFALFSKRIMENYSWWHFVIRDYLRSPNKDDYIIAFEISDLYYRKVAEFLSNVPCQIPNSGPVLDFFTSELKKYLLSSEKREVSVALKNIGYFAPACKSQGKLAVIEDLFREMAEIVEKFSLGLEEDFDIHLSADMLISLTIMARNLEGQFVDEEERGLDVLIKLGRYVIVSYPKVPFRFQLNVKRALVRSFIQIAGINEYFLTTFLDQVVFVCLIQTCSHLTENDVTLLKELGASDKDMTSYKNFVPLWRDLCNLRNVSYLETIPDCEKMEFGRHEVDQRIFDSFIKSTLKILEKLDLSVNEDGMLQEPLLSSDSLPEIDLKNESDYIILHNLIELFSVVVENCEFEMLKPTIPLLIKTFVEYARAKPIKSGFFHLLTTVFKKSGSSFCFEENPDLYHLLHSFFVDILIKVDEFHGPELITCLQMMINAPISIVKTVILSRISILFKAVFDIGREDIVLALDGLKSLENVYSKIPLQDFEVVLQSVIPHLRYYLETSNFVGETDSLTKYEEDFVASALTKSKDNTLKKYYKYISSANVDLSTLQEEIVKFLSTVDAKYCTSLYTPRICTFTESYNYLKFDIPFGDMKVNVFLDKFLPRTMEIACNSSDLKTRVVACEFLHSVITIFVANSTITLTYPKEIRQLFNDLVSCSLKLGCDINSVVKQMFLPLCKQITRHYASRPLTDNPGTKILLNILFNGISDKTDNALRHLCAKLIRIFVQWSFEKTKIHLRRRQVPVNVEAAIQKICFYCVLPCSYNKLGAALAFINLYDVLKSDSNVLNEFWLEILVAFVKSLFSSAERDCNNEVTRKALGFIGRILCQNSEIFKKEDDRRRIPQSLSSTRIRELVVVIFEYSTSKNKHCRYACMNLISNLSAAAGYASLQSFFEDSPSTRNTVLDYYFECLSVDPDVAIFEINTTVEKLEQLRTYLQTSLSGLHGLKWSLLERIINFDSSRNVDSRFWISFKFFCEKVLPQNFSECVTNLVHVPVEKDTAFVSDFASLKDQIFLEYLKIFAFCGNQFDALIGDELYQINLWKYLVSFIFSQFKTDESVDRNRNESSESVLLSVLQYFKNCSDPRINSVYAQISDPLNSCKLWITLENFKNQSELIVCLNDQRYLHGAIMLQKAGILSSVMQDIDFHQRKIFNNVFEALNADYFAVSYTSSTRVISFLENVLIFCLPAVYEETVFNFIFDENPVSCRRQTAEMTRGRHFFSTFPKLFASYMSEHQVFLVSRHVFSVNDLSKQKIQIILDCLSYQFNFDDFICVVYEQWFATGLLNEHSATLESYIFDFMQQTSKRYKNCTKFSLECQSNVFQWLVQRLTHSDSPVLKKERIIRLLPAFVRQHEDGSNSEKFQFVLGEFKKQYLDLNGQCILSETEFKLLFMALLTLLRESQNVAALQLVINFRAFDSKSVCDDGIEENLCALMRQQPSDYQLSVINVVYNFIRNNNNGFSEDFMVDIVNLFLIPCLRIAGSETVINFFSAEFQFLIQSLKSTERNLTSGQEKTEIIRQICSIRLIEAYCDCVRNLDCPIVTQALYPNGENMLRKELIKLLRSVIQTKATLHDATNSTVFRLMKCFAYNTLIKIIKKIQTEEKFYNLLFIESHRDKIWKHLVDCCEIKLSMVPEQISTKKKNFKRKKVKRKSNDMHSLPSQYLSTSSLVEDIVKYDFSGWTQTDSSFENVASYDTIDLEEEILNQHECMVPLCDLLKFLVDRKISPTPNLETDVNPQMRPWMEYLHASLESYSREKNKNVIMFLIRLIYNCEHIFMPYASNWIDLIVKCLIFLDDVNYFTSDIITMLTFTWRNRCVPKNELANNLFRLLLRKIDGNPTIRNYQLDLIGAIIDSWHSVLDANFTFLQPQLKEETVKEINLRIGKRFLLHAIFPFSRENRAEYLKNLLQLTRSNLGKKPTQLTFEVFALILRTAQTDSTIINAAESAELKEKLATCLMGLTSNNATRTDLFYSSLDHVVIYYPQIVDKFSTYLLNNFKKLQGIFKIKCLKILAKTSEHLDDVFALLIRSELITCLQTNEYDLQVQALAVLSAAVPKFQDDDVNKFLPVLAKLSTHPSAKCRRATYEILNSILLNYNDRYGDQCEEIKLHCKTILLNGLLDHDSSLQQEMFNSWKSRLSLNEEVANRFMKIISEMYSPSNESQFVSYAVDFLLDASSLVSDYESNIYETPLMSNDEFQEYHILRGSSSTRSILPEFVSSISHQMKKILTQNPNFSSLSLRLHSPQSDFVFQPSLHSGTFLPKRAGSTNSDVEKTVQSPSSEIQFEKDKLRRRLFRSQGEATDHFASIQVGRKERRKALIAQKYRKVDQKITFCRKYRDGNYPDIQIPRSAVIVPLQILAKRDITFARIVLVNILEEILTKIPDKKDYLRRVNETFNKMLKSSYKHDRVFVETLMEIAFFHVDDISLDSNLLATVSHSSGLFSLGTLLLENSIQTINPNSEEHVSKKLKTDNNLNDRWTQLADLYSSLNESDVVNGILQEKVSSNTSSVMKEGLAHEQAGHMAEAMETYKKGLKDFGQQTTKSYDEHFITEAFFKCANYLSMFDEINGYILDQFESPDALWKDNWDIEHTLPWFFTSEAYLRVEDDRESSLLDSALNSWLEDKNRSSLLTNLVAEQMAILLVSNKQKSKASLIVKDCLKFLINDWNSSKISLNHFHRLQILSEINIMLEILDNSNNEVDVKIYDLLKSWERCIPEKSAINFWDRRIMNRTLFIQKFSSELSIDDEVREQLTNSRIVSRFQVLESAVDQGNYEMAYKYFIFLHDKEFSVEGVEELVVPDNYYNRFYLSLSKICLLKKQSDIKIDDFQLCLEFLETGKVNSGFEYFAHLAELMSKILENINLFLVTRASEEKLISQLRRILKKPNLRTENLLHEVSVCGVLENLEKSATSAINENKSRNEISSVYLTMAKYCRKFVDNEPGNLIYEENLTRSLLKALKFGSKESQILFPTLLHLSQITSDSVKEVFLTESDKIEEWKYLPWVHQLLAYVSTDFISLIEHILRKIVERFPNSLQFTLYSTIKNFNCSSSKARELIDDLRKKVDPHGKILKLIEAFSHIRSPDSFFDHWWTQLYKITKRNNMLSELNVLEEQLMQAVSSKGELFSTHPLLRTFNECIGKLKNNLGNQNLVETTVRQLKSAISESQSRPLSDRHELLELYSPSCVLFTDWCGENIEIPGQYDGFSVPVPEKHVKMHSFHKRVKVQISKQKPIKVKIIGNDAKKYAYLVKFEDDMRQDQRIQQIFSLINQCASSSEDTNSKNLSVVTYGVYPLEADFGIIEWVEKTTTLKEFLDYGLSNDEKTYWKRKRADLINDYHSRLGKQFVSGSSCSEMEVYEEAVKKYNKNFVVSSFQTCCREIPDKVFRNALLALGNSPSIFWNLRNTFMRAYSTMCIYGWMLGIGDRHLKNTLVCLKTGNCIGIDFGYAFGAGVECTRIPELIPFRMTPHLKYIMAPMYLTGLIRETMIATLKKFRQNEQVLVAALQIFILEPAFNYYWFNFAKKQLEENETVEELRCYPAQKVDTIRSKLMGTNPVVILIDEIRKNQVISSQYKSALVKLVSERNRCVEDNLGVSIQVDQLLNLATDEGILGISWCGLETYI